MNKDRRTPEGAVVALIAVLAGGAGLLAALLLILKEVLW